MTRDDCRIEVNGEKLQLDVSGALWWPAGKTVVFADLHLEKGSAYARGRQFLPPYDTRATIRRMEEVAAHFRPQRVIALGDSFHDGDADARLDGEERDRLGALTLSAEWIWVEGNHDPDPPAWLGGKASAEIAVGGLIFRHEPSPMPCRGEVAGHLHPAARISRGGVSVRRRCFLSDGARLILPAFGAYAGGLDVRDKAVTGLFEKGFAVYALGREKVYAVSGPAHVRPRKIKVAPQPNRSAIRTVDNP
jgi:uncharacterized protein